MSDMRAASASDVISAANPSREAKHRSGAQTEAKYWSSSTTIDAARAGQGAANLTPESRAEGDNNGDVHPLNASDQPALAADPPVARSLKL
jgi:hypothetical protein